MSHSPLGRSSRQETLLHINTMSFRDTLRLWQVLHTTPSQVLVGGIPWCASTEGPSAAQSGADSASLHASAFRSVRDALAARLGERVRWDQEGAALVDGVRTLHRSSACNDFLPDAPHQQNQPAEVVARRAQSRALRPLAAAAADAFAGGGGSVRSVGELLWVLDAVEASRLVWDQAPGRAAALRFLNAAAPELAARIGALDRHSVMASTAMLASMLGAAVRSDYGPCCSRLADTRPFWCTQDVVPCTTAHQSQLMAHESLQHL